MWVGNSVYSAKSSIFYLLKNGGFVSYHEDKNYFFIANPRYLFLLLPVKMAIWQRMLINQTKM